MEGLLKTGGVANVDETLARRFNELKTEIQETRQEGLAAVKCQNQDLTFQDVSSRND